MKTSSKNCRLVVLASAWLACALPGHATAQTYTILHQFAPGTNLTNSDGFDPNGLVLAGNTVYGTTPVGGTNGGGTVFAVNTDGTSFRLLYTFLAINGSCNACSSSEGYPLGFRPSGLLLSGSTLYGARRGGGIDDSGTIFTLNTDGTGFTTLYSFSPGSNPSSGGYINSDGAGPDSLILSGNTLYGAAGSGGNNSGTIFAVNTDGTGFTILYSFAAGGFSETPFFTWTNSDGFEPNSLVLSQSTLYGTTRVGGSSGSGEVFAVNTDGTGFRILHRFTLINNGKNSDGAVPVALALSGGILYGATLYGGSSGAGTVFSINTNGTGFKTLSSGMSPLQLLSAGNALYGISGLQVFALKTDGSGFTILHSFSGQAFQYGALISSNNAIYGGFGGSSSGTVFSLSLPFPSPKLTIARDGSGGYFIDAQGQPNFTCQLERAPDLAGPWTTNAPQTADTDGLIQFHDMSPPFGHAFYRTVQR